MLKQFGSLFDLFEAFPDEQSAIDHLRAIRWKNGAYCPYCKSSRVMHFSDKKTHKCSDCRQRFSIKVGTIFEDTKLPLRKWFAAIWLVTSHKKGIASTQLAKDMKITQKSAWFVLHRLRYAARTRSFARPLEGNVQVDEAMFGGKEGNKPVYKRNSKNVNGVGKTIVIGMVEERGEVRAHVIPNQKGKTLKGEVLKHIAPGATVITDEHNSYNGLPRWYRHERVNHRSERYVSATGFHTNSVEGMWSLFKRQYHGTHHWISPKHLDAYLGEMCYRWNRRDMGEGERCNALLGQVEGRLTYKALIA